MKRRFANWLCAPLAEEIAKLRAALQTLAHEHQKLTDLSEHLVSDLNHLREELQDLRQALPEHVQEAARNRRRVVGFRQFAAAATDPRNRDRIHERSTS